MQIREMVSADVHFVVQLAASEGWTSETQDVWEGFLTYNPHSCFVGEIENKIMGLAVAVPYETSGFFGELLLSPNFRGHGYGEMLLNHSVDYLKKCGSKEIYLDGVLPAVSLYERSGFKKICRSLRFSGNITGQKDPRVRNAKVEDLDLISCFDKEVFGEDRSFFLKRRLELNPDLCKIYEEDGHIQGFIMGRNEDGLIWAGPWIVKSECTHPEKLLQGLCKEGVSSQLKMGVLENNGKALICLQKIGFQVRSDAPWRMVIGTSGRLGNAPESFAVGSPVKG